MNGKGVLYFLSTIIVFGAAETINNTQQERGEPRHLTLFGEHGYELTAETTYYEEAKEDCIGLGGYLVRIETIAELDFVANDLGNQLISKIWVGGINMCLNPQPFDPFCWKWEQTGVTIEPSFWHADVFAGNQNRMTRPYFNIATKKLFLESGTKRNRYYCEIEYTTPPAP